MKNDLPKRKSTRLKGYNYSESGAYFITICTKNKEYLLGQIVGGGDFDAPKMILSEYGSILDKYINLMNDRYSHIRIDKYVIMPNHFHMIINITQPISGASETAAPYNYELPKFISLLKRYCNTECNQALWQRSYHDHIIRGEKDYTKIWEYIDTNIIKWDKDCFYKKEEIRYCGFQP